MQRSARLIEFLLLVEDLIYRSQSSIRQSPVDTRSRVTEVSYLYSDAQRLLQTLIASAGPRFCPFLKWEGLFSWSAIRQQRGYHDKLLIRLHDRPPTARKIKRITQ